MTRFELQQLRDLPIEGVAERLGLQVSRHKCLCPFHDDHRASLTFKNNKFKCWSCGESGNTISLAEKVLGKDFKEACQWLADGKLCLTLTTTPPANACSCNCRRFSPTLSATNCRPGAKTTAITI